MFEHDGLCFIPNEIGELTITFFKTNKDIGSAIDGSNIGAMYHVVFIKEDDDGVPFIDDYFEAIFGDPLTYVKNLIGANIYGIMLKKTEQSTEWFKDYVTVVLANIDEYKKIME